MPFGLKILVIASLVQIFGLNSRSTIHLCGNEPTLGAASPSKELSPIANCYEAFRKRQGCKISSRHRYQHRGRSVLKRLG